MTLLVHCLAADLRRSWPAIAAWVLVVAGAAAVDGIRPLLASDVRALNLAGAVASLLWLTEIILVFVLTALVVQTHSLVGSDAFWMTRPIPPRTLLASKLVLLGTVMVVFPFLVDVVLMAAYHVPARQTVSVAAYTALTRAVIVIFLMTAAALTRNFSRFAVLCASAAGAAAILISIALTIAMSRADFATATLAVSTSGTPSTLADEDPTSAFVWNVLVVIVGLGVLAVQYRTRSRGRAATLGVAGLLLVFAIADEWPWPFLRPHVAVPQWTAEGSALRLTADPLSLDSREEGMFGRRAPWTSVRARVHLAGVEPTWSATVALLNASIQREGGAPIRTARAGYAVGVPGGARDEDPTRAAVRDVLGVQRLMDDLATRGESPIVFVTRGANAGRSAPATGRYQGLFRVTLSRHEVEATLPLRAGAAHQNGSYRIVVDDIERASRSVIVLARESRASSPFERALPWMYSFYLRNRQTSEAFDGSVMDVREGPFFSRLLPFGFAYGSAESSGFIARGLMIRFPQRYGGQEAVPAIDETWIRGAELVVVRTKREGSVQRELDIPDFPLPADPSS